MGSAGRDRFVDLLRGGSVLAVVVGHWLAADVRWSGGELVDTSALKEVPAMWPITWPFLVIPLFFFVGGYANRRSWEGTLRRGQGYASFLDRRLHRVLAPTAVYLAVVAVVGWLADASGGLGVKQLGGLLYQSLWFLGAYLWVLALVPVTLAAHRRFGPWVLFTLGCLIVIGDLGRFALGISLAGYLNVLWVWLLMHQLGYLLADGGFGRATAARMAGGGLALTLLLVATPTYPGTMVAVPGVSEGNMHPPTLAVTTLGIAQIGLCVLFRPLLNRWLQRPRVWAGVVLINLNVVTIFLWHQAALIGAARLALPLGYPDPAPGSPAWWLAHTVWLTLPAVTLLAIIALVGRAEQVHPPRGVRPGHVTAALAAIGVVLVGLAFLDLAGSSAMGLFQAGERLGPITASPLLGFALLTVGAVAFPLLRHWAPAAP